ncbi:MAG TPA: hypothetical protein PK777_09270, partial [Thermoguttaceae bacterium]|nr:hypothetical protein [Thermoguttaceae bacterium]
MVAGKKPAGGEGKTVRKADAKSPGRPASKTAGEILQSNPDLKSAITQIEKQYGEGAIMPLGSHPWGQIEGIPTGSLSLDLALGGQGIPRGRVVEIFGPESSG